MDGSGFTPPSDICTLTVLYSSGHWLMITTDVHEFDLGLVNVVADNVIARFRLRESGLVCAVPAHFGA
jgi:hypothetical protein